MKSARAAGLTGCRRCARPVPLGTPRCPRCNARITAPSEARLWPVWAWWLAGLAAYVPAMALPMLQMRVLFQVSDDPVIPGAVKLLRHGEWLVALVILVASVLVPLAKFAVIGWLALSVRNGSGVSPGRRFLAFEAVEYIGRWSMIDVFVVAVLSSLVQFNIVATVTPGPAAGAFALSVIFTMLSAQAFDSRLLWLQPPGGQPPGPPGIFSDR